MNTPRDRLESVLNVFQLSQSELARRIGVTPQLISQIMNNKLQLSFLTARAIESEYGVSASWLLTGEGEMQTKRNNLGKELNLVPSLVNALKQYPGIACALNELSERMTLEDWEALNRFVCRKKAPAETEEQQPV